MNTNHECKNKQLSDTLSVFFENNVNLAHIKLISLFMMALCKAGTVCFSMLPKRETSNTQERIDLVQRYINLFDADTIDCLLADREFVGERWVNWLNDNCIRYFIRIRDNSFNKPEDAVETYRQCWQIETMFKAMKSVGFNIETTHLSDIERIEKLLLIVMMAFLWCYNIGEFVHRNLKPIRVLRHGRKEKSIFRYGLDILTEFLARDRNDHQLQFFDFLVINEMPLNVTG